MKDTEDSKETAAEEGVSVRWLIAGVVLLAVGIHHWYRFFTNTRWLK